MTNKRVIFLFIVLTVAVFFVLLPRFSHHWLSKEQNGFFYSYPLHADEWQHYTIASSLKDNFFQPKVLYYQEPVRFIDGSPLFHRLIFLSQKLGISPEGFFILPLLQGIFFSLVFFLFLSLVFSPFLALIAGLLVFSLRSDVGILGILFFKPFILGFAFLILGLFFFHRKKGFSFWFFLASLAAILCYPPLILLLFIYTLVYQLVNKSVEKKHLFWLGVLILLTLIFGWFITKDKSLLIDKIFYRDSIIGWGGFSLMRYWGPVLIIFGLMGFIKTLKRKDFWPWHALFLFFLLNFIFLLLTKASFGFHYVRIIYFTGIFFTVYAAQTMIDVFKQWRQQTGQKTGAVIFILLFVLLMLFPNFMFYAFSRNPANAAAGVYWLTKDSQEALRYLKNLPDKNKKILHSEIMGTVLTPLTGFKATALQVALTGGIKNEYYDIIKADCERIKEIVKEENYQLLWLNKKIDCSFLKPVLENETTVIYQPVLNEIYGE